MKAFRDILVVLALGAIFAAYFREGLRELFSPFLYFGWLLGLLASSLHEGTVWGLTLLVAFWLSFRTLKAGMTAGLSPKRRKAGLRGRVERLSALVAEARLSPVSRRDLLVRLEDLFSGFRIAPPEGLADVFREPELCEFHHLERALRCLERELDGYDGSFSDKTQGG